MTSNYIFRKLEKTQISASFKLAITTYISQFNQKYPKKCNQKNFSVKKLSKKILKLCRKYMDKHNLDDCLRIFEFVKNIMMQLYQGLSYEVYLLKTQLHLLIMKWFQLSLKYQKRKYKMIKAKQQIFISRNKLFIEQVQRSSMASLFFKDYYSNIELILFQIIKLDIQKRQYQTANLTIKKTFQTLKMQVLELNQLLFHLQKKVYNVIEAKTKLMVDLFVLETVTHFLNMFVQNKQQFQSTMQNSNLKLLKMNSIWAKYAKIFQKLPNNMEKQETFKNIQQILSNNQIISSSGQLQMQMQRIQQEKNQSESSNSNSDQQNQKQNQSKINRNSQLVKTKNKQKRRSSFKNMKEDQYEDFINFLIQDKHVDVDKLQLNNVSEYSNLNQEDKSAQLSLFKSIFAKAYLKKQQKSEQTRVLQDDDMKQSVSKSLKLNIVKNQKQYNLFRLKGIKSNSLTLLQKLKTQQTQKLKHDNPFQKQDLHKIKRSYSVDLKAKKQVVNFNNIYVSQNKKKEKSEKFNSNCNQKKKCSFNKNTPLLALTSVKLPILLIK